MIQAIGSYIYHPEGEHQGCRYYKYRENAMSFITAEISLYPLGAGNASESIDGFIDALTKRGLTVRVGAMSSYIEGEADVVFDALKDAFGDIARKNPIVLSVTVSNTCPAWFEPEERKKGDPS